MKAFIRKYIKNGLLYASIGLFVVVGLYVVTAVSVNASPIYYTSSINGSGSAWNFTLQGCTGAWYKGFKVPIGATTVLQDNSGNICGTNNQNIAAISSGTDGNYNYAIYLDLGTHTADDPYGIDNAAGIFCANRSGGVWTVGEQYCQNYVPPVVDTSTHFVSVSPANGTTTATTSSIGATLYADSTDFPNYGRLHGHFTQDSAFACQNSGAVYDAVFTCSGDNAPASPFDIDFSTTTLNRIIAGDYSLFQTVTFPGGGNWTGVYTIDQVSEPWYLFGLFNTYNTLVSTTTHFTIGQLSPMDIVREEVMAASVEFASTTHHGIGAILASTTASLISACNPFSLSGDFSLGDCLTLTIWPGESAIAEDFDIIKQTPPWGYVFRVIDIFSATTSTTTLPTIDYSFASTSPMSAVGNIHFDPFASIAAAGTLINEMHSDQEGAPTVWTILMPIVNIFVYLVLAFMIIHDLTGIHRGNDSKQRHDDTKD